MSRFPFFGSNNDDEQSDTDGEYDGVHVTSNRKNANVNIIDLDDPGPSLSTGGLRVHTISMNEGATEAATRTDSTTPSSGDDPGKSKRVGSTPTPTVDPKPTSTSYPRGTFVLPENRHFLQKLEARGRNGHRPIVETVYVLTGPTYTQPTDLIRLDNESYYGSATRSSVRFDPRAMARKVANLYPDGEAPKLIARFHTHPGGNTLPSSADKNSAPKIRKSFVDAFGSDDFELFHGIHGLKEHGKDPSPEHRQSVSVRDAQVQWLGERYQHKIAVYGRRFETKKDVVTDGGT